MPYKKPYRKRPYRKRRGWKKIWKRKAPAPSSGITRPRVIRFKRQDARTIKLGSLTGGTGPDVPTGWSADLTSGNLGIYRQVTTNLADVPDYPEFQALFSAYRIKGLRIQGFVSNTESAGGNQQLMLYWNQNWQGTQETTLLEKFFLDRPRSKRKVLLGGGSKPAFDIYQPLRQLSLMYGSITNSDYGTTKPKWISKNETQCEHYGFNLRIAKVNGEDFTAGTTFGYPSIKLIYTWYLEFRGVS